MKIIFVFPHFLPNIGGTELTMFHYAKELVKRGHKVTIFTANAIKLKPAGLKERATINGVTVERFKFLPLPFYNKFFFAPFLIPRLLSVRGNLFQIFSLTPSFFMLITLLMAKIRKIPVILYPQFHPQRSLYHSNVMKRMIGTFFDKKIGPIITRKADYVIALTTSEAEFHKKNRVKNVKVIRGPIWFNGFPQKHEIIKFMKKYGLQKEHKIILTVARLEKYKGVHILIKAIPKMLKFISDVKLIVVGEDWGFLSECIRYSSECNCKQDVIFTGRISDKELSCAYAISNIVVIPSFSEGYGLGVLEAWNYSKPVITTTNVGLSEVVSKCGGYVVKARSPEDIAQAVIRLLSNPNLASRVGQDGYRLLQGEFTLKVATSKIEEIYNYFN